MTPDDRKSIERWCRHLLRHLDEPPVLRENELVAQLFREGADLHYAMSAVRGLLRAAANTLVDSEHGHVDDTALRHHAILTRCDLAGEPHKRVAAQLGLSMRHFYRERGEMVAWLAEYLAQRLRAPRSVVNAPIDIFSLELARARALQYGGYSTLALVLLRSIAESGGDPAIVVAAGCQYVSVLLEHNDFAQCREQLEVLERYLAQKGLTDPAGLHAQRVALERRNLHGFSGDELLARELDGRERASIMRLAQTENQAAQEFAIKALTFAARRLFMNGLFAQARETLDAVHDILSRLQERAPADLEVSFLILYGALLVTTRDSLTAASRALHDAASLAARHGASELAVLAAIGLSIDDQMRGDMASALKRVCDALPLAEKVASPLNYAQLCLRIAELNVETRDIPAAEAMLNEAEQDLIEGTYAWTYLTLMKTQASLAVHDYVTAKACAERAIKAAGAQRNDRLEGVAFRSLAEAYIGLNARSAAVQAVETAIEKLERCGHVRALAAAYRIAAKLTGRAKYARAADDLAHESESA